MRQCWYTDHVLCHINCSIVCFDLQVNDKLFGILEKNVHVPYKSESLKRKECSCAICSRSRMFEVDEKHAHGVSGTDGKTMPWITLDKIVCNCKM